MKSSLYNIHKISNSETSIYFETIEPKTYILRVIYDDNSNGIWDTGNYLAKNKPKKSFTIQNR